MKCLLFARWHPALGRKEGPDHAPTSKLIFLSILGDLMRLMAIPKL